MAKFNELYDFIDRAERSRKYPPETAKGLRVALRLYGAELNQEELESVEKFKENLDQISQIVFNKNKNFSAGSLTTYRSRVSKVLGEFEKYGQDPAKMSSWSPKLRSRTPKAPKSGTTEDQDFAEPAQNLTGSSGTATHRIELSVRPGVKCIVVVPQDLTAAEGQKLKNLIDTLAS